MNSPAKRFSLTKILGGPAPESAPPQGSSPAAVSEVAEDTTGGAGEGTDAERPAMAVAESRAEETVRIARKRREEPAAGKAPKKKRSYTVDMRLCDDLEILAWYHDRSTSSLVEELVRKHLAQNRSLLEKAHDMRRMR